MLGAFDAMIDDQLVRLDAARLGFAAVEFWWPAGEDLLALARHARDAGVQVALFNFDGGDLARRFCAANLVFGAYDLSLTASQRLWGERNLVLSRPLIDYFAGAFAPGRSLEERRAPEISPLYAELRGLVPALFTVGTLDPLLDDSLFMASRWWVAGNDCALRVWPDAVHGFNAFPIGVTRLATAAVYEYLRRALAGG